VKLFLTMFLFFSVMLNAEQPTPHSTNDCVSFTPFGLPMSTKANTKLICRSAYITLNDLNARLPVYVAYTLTPDHAIGCLPRKNQFSTDQSLPIDSRATPEDYEKSGYDIGHMSPDSDNSFNAIAMQESFILSNMSPQLPGLNRENWEQLESSIRNWAVATNHSLTIYVGPIYTNTDPTMGNNKVVVPHGFYKIVIDDTTHHVLEFVYPQADEPKSVPLSKFLVSHVDVDITFPLPADAVIDTTLWPLTNDETAKKKIVCEIK